MMKYTDSFDDEDTLPQMRSCHSATTIATRKQERSRKSAIRRVAFEDEKAVASRIKLHGGDFAYMACEDDRTVASAAKSCGGNSSYVSLGENTDDGTICSSHLYSMHNYSPAMKAQRKAKGAYTGNLCCPSLSLEELIEEVEGTLEDTMKSFKQIMEAFVIAPEDIDGMADIINDAEEEIMELELERRWSKLRKLERRMI